MKDKLWFHKEGQYYISHLIKFVLSNRIVIQNYIDINSKFSLKDYIMCNNSFMLFVFLAVFAFATSTPKYVTVSLLMWSGSDIIKRCKVLVKYDSVVFHFAKTPCLPQYPEATIILGIIKFTVLWIDTVECNISDTLGEPCSKST